MWRILLENKMQVSIIGGSGYAGGELLRLLLGHDVEIKQVTSETYKGKSVSKVHPNLRKVTDLKFSSADDLEETDLIFSALPHGVLMNQVDSILSKTKKLIDLSGDFRLRNPEDYETWYGHKHKNPELLKEFVYGIPELHRNKIKKTDKVACAGCNATAVILALYPLLKENVVDLNQPIIAESKCGSSEGGNKPSLATHHPERTNVVRSYKPTRHRHAAEMLQELSFNKESQINFSATSIQLVRGILATSHVFLKDNLDEKEIWNIYRKYYNEEPFVRIIKERTGIYRYPEPKLLAGTNYCDIGFEKDTNNRLVVISAIDNLMKGAAGQAVQSMNIMLGLDETTGLEFPGLHPI